MKSLIFADYHTHTVYSHGTGTVEENVLAAIEHGLSALAIADHGPGQIAHGVSLKKLQAQIEEIAVLREKYKDKINIYCGTELDVFSDMKMVYQGSVYVCDWNIDMLRL